MKRRLFGLCFLLSARIVFGSIIVNMRVKYRPNTVLGVWSVRLIGVSILFFILFFVISNLSLTIPIRIMPAVLAVCAFFTGITSIFRNRERAVFVFISTVLGFLVLLFGLAEIIFPH